MKLTLTILFLATSLHAMDYMSALSQVESGDRDNVIGAQGEISRYQICKNVWRVETSLPYAAASNPFTARNVADAIIKKRVDNFIFHHHRWPSAFEFYRLWSPHCPRETAQRFENLVNAK